MVFWGLYILRVLCSMYVYNYIMLQRQRERERETKYIWKEGHSFDIFTHLLILAECLGRVCLKVVYTHGHGRSGVQVVFDVQPLLWLVDV